MSQVLDDLLSLMSLEEIEQGLYRGQSQDLGFRAVFGGQVMGQALSAAKEHYHKGVLFTLYTLTFCAQVMLQSRLSMM